MPLVWLFTTKQYHALTDDATMPSKTSWLKVHPTKCRIIYVRGWMSFGLKSGHPSGSYWLQLAAEVIQEKSKSCFYLSQQD